MSIKYTKYTGTFDDGEFPEILYKYRDWDIEYHNRYILKREIYMAPASSFVDENDCKIPIRYDLLNKKQTIQFSIRLQKIEQQHLSRQQHRDKARKWAKKGLLKNKQFYDDFQKDYFKEIDKHRGILCLTEFPCLDKMWDDYAKNSTGFCVGYNSRILFEFLGGGGNVTYDDLPIILPEPFMTHEEIHHKQVFYKEKKWNFENEYRTHKFYENPPTKEMRQIVLPKEVFNRIILGKNISIENRNAIIEGAKENIGDIPVLDYLDVC